jgi:hypothetical protein
MLAVDDMYRKPRASIVVSFVADGKVDISKFQETVRRNLLEATRPDGSLMRPEMTHYISQWLGFYFWKKDSEFSIQNHFHAYDGPSKCSSYTALKFFEIAQEFLVRPFTKHRSPWEFIFFPNCIDSEKGTSGTGICLRIHHSLGDGFSILKLFGAITTTKGQFFAEQKKEMPMSPFRRFWEIIGSIFLLPYEATKTLFEINIDSNAWHIPESKFTHKLNGSAFEPIPLNYIKEIKNLSGSSFTSVLYAAFAGGIRNTMLQQGVKVPKAIHCFAPLPIMGHPEKLRNVA